MNIFLKRSIFFIVPILLFFVILSVVDLLLPIDYFNFRVWESLSLKTVPHIPFGPFYPNMTIEKDEVGELGAHTEYAIIKKVKWVTDSYGFRYDGSTTTNFDIVVIGDSFIAGSALTQSDMYDVKLRELLNQTVYPLGAANINTFINDKRFIDSPPKVVIISSVERMIPNLAPINNRSGVMLKAQFVLEKIYQNKKILPFLFTIDRLSKFSIVNKARSILSINYGQPLGQFCNGNLFSKEQVFSGPIDEKKYQLSLARIKSYGDYFQSRNIKFIFLPIPNKETIYYKDLNIKRSDFLTRLLTDLRNSGITVVDTNTIFQKAYEQQQKQLYFSDDSHWNTVGTSLAASITADLLVE